MKAPGESFVPWMHETEIEHVLASLASASPRRMLEWGAGGSTKLFLDRLATLEELHSIEHDRDWFERIRSGIVDPRLNLHHVPANLAPPPGTIHDHAVRVWAARAETDASIMADYVMQAARLGGRFDAVFVDGRARRFCLRAGHGLLRPGGVIVLHDAQRPAYHDVLREIGEPRFLDGWKQGQVCVVVKR